MASTETVICNQALQLMGQSQIDDIDGTAANEVKCALIYDQDRDELLAEGPEQGWKFATKVYNKINQDSITIASITQNGTDITITGTHALTVGDLVELTGDTGYDGSYEVTAISTTATFDVTATFVATGTGTAYWRSNDYSFRYAIPTSKAVLKVSVGGIELTDWTERGVYILTNMEDEEVDMRIVQAITTVTLFPDHFVRALVLKMAVSLTHAITQDLALADRLTLKMEDAIKKAIAVDERGKYVREFSSSWQDMGNTRDIVE